MNAIRNRVTVLAANTVILFSVIALAEEGGSSANARHDVAVAIVNGHEVPYSAIKVATEMARIRFAYEHERDPRTESDIAEVETIRRQYEVKRLADHIRTTIREQQIDRFNISCTDSELKIRWERLLEDRDPLASQAARNAKISNLLACLTAVHEEAADADVVYETQLSFKLTRKQWRAVVRQYRSPEQRAALSKILAEKIPDLDDYRDAVTTVLLSEKLDAAIEKELAQTDSEFAEHIRLSASDPGNEKLRSKGPTYKAAKRHEWWQARYREADIKIADDRFRQALRLLFE